MIKEEVQAVNVKTGKRRTITEWTPENQEDVEELRRMDREGKLDTRHSFADDPEAWE